MEALGQAAAIEISSETAVSCPRLLPHDLDESRDRLRAAWLAAGFKRFEEQKAVADQHATG